MRRRFLSSYYRALHPMTPEQVRAMTPSEVSAALGLDLEDTIRAVPQPDEFVTDDEGHWIPPQPPPGWNQGKDASDIEPRILRMT